MKQIIETTVYDDRTGEAVILKIIFDEDVVTFVLDEEEVFSGDWTANFFKVFCKAIGNWELLED
jgi:hypothetical protein